MKNLCLCFLLIFLMGPGLSQETPVHEFYQTTDAKYTFEIKGKQCVLYELSQYDSYVLNTEELNYTGDSSGVLFSNRWFAVSYDGQFFRVSRLKKNGKLKDKPGYLAKKVGNPEKIYEAINHTYWSGVYQKIIDDISLEYELFTSHYYWNRNRDWDSFQFKQAEPEEFEKYAFEEARLLKDSLSTWNAAYLALNMSVESRADSMDLQELNTIYFNLPLYKPEYGQYVDEMLTIVAEKRPDLFLALAESLPDQKQYIFDQVIFSRDGNKALKKYRTDSPVKKEYLRYMRWQKLKAGLILTAAGTAEIGIVGGLIFLFTRL